MQIGLVGRGPMGRTSLRPLVKVGHTTVVWDGSQGTTDVLGIAPQHLRGEGPVGAPSVN
jgi:hypothetical protein